MIKNKEIEVLEHSSVKLTVTIDKESIRSEYQKILDKYAKTAHLKGFRKGKAPASLLEKKFGESITIEASMNAIEDSLKNIFGDIEEKPLPNVVPEMQEDPEFALDKDLTFTVVYDTFPKIEIGEYKGIEVKAPDVTVTKEDEEREIKTLQEQNSMVVEKKEGLVESGNIVTIDYEEITDPPQPKSRREGFVFTVGTGYNLYKIDDDIIGMKKDEERDIDKEYPEDYEIAELKGRKVKVRVKVTAIKEKQLPALDDELAQDINEKYKTLADLKADIAVKINEAAEMKIKERNIGSLMDHIIEGSKIDLPVSMIKSELNATWSNFVAQFRAPEQDVLNLLSEQGRTKEDLLAEWTPNTEKKIKNRLVMTKIIDEEKIIATDDEIEEEIKKQAQNSNTPIEDLQKRFENFRMRELLKSDIEDKKLFDYLLGQAKIKKGEKIKFLDLMQDKQ